MDSSQLLLTVAITITTILVVLTGLQLLFAVKELRQAIKATGNMIWKLDRPQEKEVRHKSHPKKQATLHAVLDKIRFLAPNQGNRSKKFFIKDNS